MSSNYRKGKLLSGILYLHRITDVRMDGSSMKYVRMFKKLCGPNALQNVLLTTTQWSNVDQAQGESREGELREGKFWGGLIAEGASIARFMGTRESGLELIDKLMGNKPKPLDIQDEIVDKGMPFSQTGAGQSMNEELASLQKKFQKELEDLKRQHEKAVKEKDDLLQEILAEQREQSKRLLEEAAAQKKHLGEMRADMMRELEEAENKREEERQRKARAVIAVASKDIGVTTHLQSLFTSYSTIGRLICDTNNAGEFKKAPFNVEIEYQSSIISPITVPWKTVAAFVGTGMSSNNYIVYDYGYYQCKPSRSVERNSQDFIIFAKC